MRCASGFTLLETLAAIALLGVALGLSVPLMQALHERHLLSRHAELLASSLRFARAHALASGEAASLCPSADGGVCRPGAYEGGWIVFGEDPAAANGRFDAGETPLEIVPPLPARLSLRANRFRTRLTFYPDGHASSAGRFVLCLDNDADKSAGVVINSAGRLRAASGKELESCSP